MPVKRTNALRMRKFVLLNSAACGLGVSPGLPKVDFFSITKYGSMHLLKYFQSQNMFRATKVPLNCGNVFFVTGSMKTELGTKISE